jgi:hypothetical protein
MANRGPTKNSKVTPLPSGDLSQRNAIRSLSCYNEVKEMLERGLSTSVIAKFIQEDQGELTNMTAESLGARLRQFRQQIVTPTQVIVSQSNPGAAKRVLSDAITTLDKSINESHALRKLLQVQFERIQEGREQEISDGRLSQQTNRDIELAAEIIEKHAKIRVDLGLPALKMDDLGDDPIQTLESQYKDVGGSVRRVLSDEGSRRRVLSIVEKVSALANIGKGTSAAQMLESLPVGAPTYDPIAKDEQSADEETQDTQADQDEQKPEIVREPLPPGWVPANLEDGEDVL